MDCKTCFSLFQLLKIYSIIVKSLENIAFLSKPLLVQIMISLLGKWFSWEPCHQFTKDKQALWLS